MKPTIGFVSQDRAASDRYALGGAGHYRLGMIASALAAQGYRTVQGVMVGAAKGGPLGVIEPEFIEAPKAVQLREAKVPNVLVMQRYMGAGQDRAVLSARAAGQVIVNDVDDLFDALPPSNHAFRATHPALHPEANVNHYRKVLAASSLITVSTPYLGERLYRYGRPIVVLRNALDLAHWAPHAPDDPPRLGWTGAVQFRANDVEQAAGAIAQALSGGYAPTFVHCGAVQGLPLADKLGVPVAEYPMTPVSEWPSVYRRFDVGVVPLSGHPFNEAKSALKGMEMAASGIPFVASATPEYRWLRATYGVGLLATRHKEWVRQLRRLLDPAEAAEQRAAGLDAVRKLDIAQRWHEWADVYESATA